MTGTSDFVMPPGLPSEPAGRLAVVWEGNPEWTAWNLSVEHTKSVDSAVNVGISDGNSSVVMPLNAKQSRQLAHELIIRADLIDPKAGA